MNSKFCSLYLLLFMLKYLIIIEEFISLNKVISGVIIIVGSGMCNGGCIKYYFK